MKTEVADAPPAYLNSVRCPHCRRPARIRSSRAMTPLVRQLYLACTNVECGHTFGADIEITHTISPSACPAPDVHLRLAPPRRRVANDNPSNDNPLPGAPEVAPTLAVTAENPAAIPPAA